ncbi:MAG: ATP-grasp domain-containing protein [Candidatus Woesearchaeota archaeon]
MVSAAIISLGSDSSKWTAEAMRKYFDEVEEVDLRHLEISISGNTAEILYKGEKLKNYDCIYAKGSFRYSQVLRSLTTIMKDQAYIPFTPEAYTVAHDKLLTHLMLQTQNVPMPKTYISTTVSAARNVLSRMNYPIIMKFPQGTQGKGVMFADSFSSASSILDALTALKQSFIIQEFIETGNSDIRAIVVGDKVIASMVRKGKSDEKRANIHAGGSGESIELDSKAKEIAVKAAKATGADICGVDILPSIKGPLVLETNISPGLQGITNYTKVDVADHIARFLYKKTCERLNKINEGNKKEIMADVNNEGTVMTTIDTRGNRILLPELTSQISKLKDQELVEIKVKKNFISIKKLDIN